MWRASVFSALLLWPTPLAAQALAAPALPPEGDGAAAADSEAAESAAATPAVEPAAVEPAAAEPPAAETSEATMTPTTGRGFTWGGSAVVPLILGDVRYAEAVDRAPFYSPGAGVLGRIGVELPFGVSLLVVGSVQAFAVEAQKALLLYRAGVEVRWTIDTGVAALPFLGAGGSLLLYSRDGSIGTTGGVHGIVGVAFSVAPWAQVELAIEVSAAFPGAAFTDTVLGMMPSVGGSFFF